MRAASGRCILVGAFMPKAKRDPVLKRYEGIISPEQYAELAEATSDTERQPGFLVILGRQEELPSSENLKSIAEGLDWDLYSTRQRLLSHAPRLLRRETRKSEALRWVSWMKALGLVGFYVQEEEFFEQEVFEITSFDLGSSRLICRGKNGSELETPLDAIICSVFGEVTEKQIREQSQHDLLMGDVSNSREVLSVKSEAIFDLHGISPLLILRFRQTLLDYPRLFPGEQMASGTQFREVFRRIREAVPHARAFNEFHRVAATLDQSWEVLSRCQNLVYNPTTRGLTKFNVRRDQVSRSSDRDAFELYSLLWRFQMLRG